MTFLNTTHWHIVAGVVCLLLVGSAAVWLMARKRPTEDALEQARRLFLSQSGRLVDGMLLDVCEMEAKDGRTRTMLIYSYRIGGVDYECSQDITALLDAVDTAQVRAGFPCSVRHQPGSPQNSIVVAETWSGLRTGLPVFHTLDDPEPSEVRQLRRRS
ncbi:MAG TPA: hypothetical protein VMV39_03750 [Terracidiphilus sp.]|nr:hypothetical protein [Terracidiphilus sp.]